MKLTLSFAALVLVSLGAGSAMAQDHDDGWLLRLSGGVGPAASKASGPAEVNGSTEFGDLEFSGPAGEINFAIGPIVAPNFALHATVAGWFIAEADVEFTPDSGGSTISGTANEDLDLTIFGVGATYYIMPANVYVTGSVGGAVLSADDSSSDTGWGLDVSAGKEWFVGAGKWGLGVAAGVTYHSIPDDTATSNWTGTSFAVRFSATWTS